MVAARVPVLVTLLVGFAMLTGSIRRPATKSEEARRPMRSAEIDTRIERGDTACHMRVAPKTPFRAHASARCVDRAHEQIDPFAY